VGLLIPHQNKFEKGLTSNGEYDKLIDMSDEDRVEITGEITAYFKDPDSAAFAEWRRRREQGIYIPWLNITLIEESTMPQVTITPPEPDYTCCVQARDLPVRTVIQNPDGVFVVVQRVHPSGNPVRHFMDLATSCVQHVTIAVCGHKVIGTLGLKP